MTPEQRAQMKRTFRVGGWFYLALFALSALLSGSFLAALTAMGIFFLMFNVITLAWSYLPERAAERDRE